MLGSCFLFIGCWTAVNACIRWMWIKLFIYWFVGNTDTSHAVEKWSHLALVGTCPHCGIKYENQSALKYHVRLVHSDFTNKQCCYLCPQSFITRDCFKSHMRSVHSVRNWSVCNCQLPTIKVRPDWLAHIQMWNSKSKNLWVASACIGGSSRSTNN